MSRQELLTQLNLGDNAPMIHCYMNQVPNDFHKLVFQNEFLGHLFKETKMLTPIEYLSLERLPVALISYLMLLNFFVTNTWKRSLIKSKVQVFGINKHI